MPLFDEPLVNFTRSPGRLWPATSRCCECLGDIPSNEPFEFATGCRGPEFLLFFTCSDCVILRDDILELQHYNDPGSIIDYIMLGDYDDIAAVHQFGDERTENWIRIYKPSAKKSK